MSNQILASDHSIVNAKVLNISEGHQEVCEISMLCFFDTPGLMLKSGGYPCKTDVKVRVESAWSSVSLYDVLIVIFDVHRHLNCSKRPWDEDPTTMSEDIMKNISLEVVREKMLHHIHQVLLGVLYLYTLSVLFLGKRSLYCGNNSHFQEIPYTLEHRLINWKELRDGSLRVEQHFITHKQSQRKILVGKNGSKIGRIGMEANEELREIFKKDVHLILQVRVA
ncbi:hypothetical protein HHK36_033318 [Tetracentron sinense]|uniref:KH type-2 domain-containing protein n=1 Tax=Tetracentron sinense TaxID=13715 RepID=A0A835CW86_TETSI|nr:hypothetical protein HHK36_033318 [Tetracentron sinense]